MTADAEADLAKISGYVNNHRKAGHAVPSSDKFPAYLTDLQTQVANAHRVIYAYRPPATIEERLSYIVSTLAAVAAEMDNLVSQIAQDTNTAVEAAAARVIAAQGDVDAIKAERDAAVAAQAAAEANAAQAQADLDTANANLATVQADLDAALAEQAADAEILTGTIATADSISPV